MKSGDRFGCDVFDDELDDHKKLLTKKTDQPKPEKIGRVLGADNHGREVRVASRKWKTHSDNTDIWTDYHVYYTGEETCEVCAPVEIDDPKAHAGTLCFTLSFHPSIYESHAMDSINLHHWTPHTEATPDVRSNCSDKGSTDEGN